MYINPKYQLDLQKLDKDYALLAQGFRFKYVLSFTELYRIVFPVLEYMKSHNKHNLFFTRQTAIRNSLERLKNEWIIPNKTIQQYEYELENVPKLLREAIFGDLFNWEQYRIAIEDIFEKLGGQEILNEYFEGKGILIPNEFMKGSFLDTLKGRFFRQEIQDGHRLFESLIERENIEILNPAIEEQLESKNDYGHLKRGYFSKWRDISTYSFADSTSELLAKIALLNLNAAKTKIIYVLVSHRNPSSKEAESAGLVIPIPEYNTEFQMIRSLYYCLLDGFFRNRSRNVPLNYKELHIEVSKLRRFIDTELPDANRHKSKFAERALDPVQHRKLEELTKETNIIEKSLRHLPVFSEFVNNAENRIKQKLGKVDSEGNLQISLALREQITDILDNPDEIFGDEEDYGIVLSELKAASQRIVKLSLEDSECATSTLSVFYPEDVFTAYELEHLKDLIFEILKKLQKWKSSDWQTLDDIENVVKSKISELSHEQAEHSSPALYWVLARICRIHKRYEEGLSLLKSARLFQTNNYALDVEQSLFYRKMAIELDEKNDKGAINDFLLESSEYIKKAIDSKPMPKIFQSAAYTNWLLFRNKEIAWFDASLSVDGERLIAESIDLCEKGLQLFGEDKEPFFEYKRLKTEQAYYIALLSNPTQLHLAVELLEEFEDELLSQTQLDTKAFVCLKNYLTSKQTKFLKDAITCYQHAIAIGSERDEIIDKGFEWSLSTYENLDEAEKKKLDVDLKNHKERPH